MRTHIHVNPHAIRRNRDDGSDTPVVIVHRGASTSQGKHAMIHGPSELKYDGHAVWIETDAEVTLT